MAVRQANLAWETLLDLSATRPGPLHMRLAAAIRAAVRDGRLPAGAALPPSRMLAADLGVSRWPTGIPRSAWRIPGPRDCGRPRRRRAWNSYRSRWTVTAWSS
ncbi:MAG TPA: GntR family transcriptional regulator, partial [Trebonia sp.]